MSIVVTWALENALDTADSMKSRGYGLPKRTAFSLFRFTLRDGICLGVLATLGGIVLAGSLTGGAEMVVLSRARRRGPVCRLRSGRRPSFCWPHFP